jgi:hypothetical protein
LQLPDAEIPGCIHRCIALDSPAWPKMVQSPNFDGRGSTLPPVPHPRLGPSDLLQTAARLASPTHTSNFPRDNLVCCTAPCPLSQGAPWAPPLLCFLPSSPSQTSSCFYSALSGWPQGTSSRDEPKHFPYSLEAGQGQAVSKSHILVLLGEGRVGSWLFGPRRRGG